MTPKSSFKKKEKKAISDILNITNKKITLRETLLTAEKGKLQIEKEIANHIYNRPVSRIHKGLSKFKN